MDWTGLKEISTLFERIIQRLPVTLEILALSAVCSLLLGILIAIVRIRKKPVSYAIATFYISFMRCTPTLVQLFLIFYGLPQLLLLMGIDVNGWSNVVFAIITLSLHNAAFFSETIRSAYLAVGEGQKEAAYSVGMNYFQTLRRIILPQAFGIALPVLGNNLVTLLKETSLAFSIGVTDMMGQVTIIVYNNYGASLMTVYMIIALIYWCLSILIGRMTAYLEKKHAKAYKGLSG
jgi:L-cystine transport system permease protein